jgi:hypothetical protein
MDHRTCSLPDCSGKHYAKGLCHRHYQRQWKRGAPEAPVATAASLALVAQRRIRARARIEDHGYETGCWVSTRSTVSAAGYTKMHFHGQMWLTHRLAYVVFVGSIDEGMQLDHLCRVPACCNPDHLEIVTAQENCHRSESPSGQAARKTHCIRGHLLAGDNMRMTKRGKRACRACFRFYAQKRRAA